MLGSEVKAEEEGKRRPQIGQWVQWEHNGILGLPQPKRLAGFSEDGQYGFVEGSQTGIPVGEIISTEPPEQPSGMVPLRNLMRLPDPSRSDQGAKMRQDVFSLAEGEAIIHWPTPLSDDSIKDLEDWLELVKRKIKRSAADATPAEPVATVARQIRLED